MITFGLIVLLVLLVAVFAGAVCWLASGDMWAWVWVLTGGFEALARLIGMVLAAIADANR